MTSKQLDILLKLNSNCCHFRLNFHEITPQVKKLAAKFKNFYTPKVGKIGNVVTKEKKAALRAKKDVGVPKTEKNC